MPVQTEAKQEHQTFRYGWLAAGILIVLAAAVFFTGQEPAVVEKKPAQVHIQKLAETEVESYTIPLEWVFGEESEATVGGMIRVSGLTGKEKKKLNFQESAFVTALSSFLKDRNLTASSVRFTRELTGSSAASQVYLAELGSETSKELIVTFFPKLPDFYLFALKEKKQEETETEKEEPIRMTEDTQVLEEQRTAPETENRRTQETENAYDASRFSIRHLPEELKNYIGNEYLLQYELYHYLYGRGNQAATDAAVTDYQIDPDTRRAEVTFSVSDGSVVTGIYWLDSGSWEFAS
ncbi:Uncharacterised protein [uncultured Clostridium sp.]|nr:Uncharacterised protein [uncultured Clostridium sp.]